MSRVLQILFNIDMVRAILDGRKTVTRRCVKYKYSNTEMKMRTDKYGTRLIEIQKDVEGETYGKNPDGSTWRKLLGYIEPKAPYQPGDILYVRECGMIQSMKAFGRKVKMLFAADNKLVEFSLTDDEYERLSKWEQSERFLSPYWLTKEEARIWLKVTDVRVERLQDITEEQAINEGISRLYDDLSDAEYEDWAKRTGIYPKAKEDWGYKNYLWHGNFGKCGTGNWKSDNWDYQYSSYDNAIGSFSSLWNSTIKKSDLERYGWEANPWVWVIEFERCEKPESEG